MFKFPLVLEYLKEDVGVWVREEGEGGGVQKQM